jgi:hypothetical protein
MSEEPINYEQLMLEAHRGVVRRVLRDTVLHGLRGEHHFFIVFNTVHPGVRLSDRLRKQYPQEMTIVLQHQFRNLRVSDEQFEVQLSFGGIPELLKVPFAAINGFVDPSVPFGLKLKSEEPAEGLENSIAMLVPGLPKGAEPRAELIDDDDDDLDDAEVDAEYADPKAAQPRHSVPGVALADDDDEQDGDDDRDGPPANIVQLDAFRKKTS